MRFLRTNTAIRITVGPFLDKTDGVTPETSLTVTNCHLTLMVDDGNVPTLVLDAAATASGGNNDMVHVTGDDAGFYDLELTAAQLNYLGRAMLAITDAANHCPVFHEFMILPANVYDALVLGTDVLQVDVSQFGNSNLTAAGGIPEVKVASIAADAITASAIAADAIGSSELAASAVNEIADQVWDEALSGHTTAGSAGKQLQDIATGTPPSAAAVADAVWDEALAGHAGAGSAGEALSAASGGGSSPEDIADAVLIRGLANVEDDLEPLSLGWLLAKGVSRIVFNDSGNQLRIYKSDGTSLLFTQVTSQAAMTPIKTLGVGQEA